MSNLVQCVNLAELSGEEIAAARQYGSESGFFHLATQSAHTMSLSSFVKYQEFCRANILPHLVKATQKYALAADATFYSGHKNGASTLGALGCNPPNKLVGLRLQYRGFTSTSSSRDVALHFASGARDLDFPVLMEFQLPQGFKLLPMHVLGADTTHEAEYLLPAHSNFEIVSAISLNIGAVPLMQLTLVP